MVTVVIALASAASDRGLILSTPEGRDPLSEHEASGSDERSITSLTRSRVVLGFALHMPYPSTTRKRVTSALSLRLLAHASCSAKTSTHALFKHQPKSGADIPVCRRPKADPRAQPVNCSRWLDRFPHKIANLAFWKLLRPSIVDFITRLDPQHLCVLLSSERTKRKRGTENRSLTIWLKDCEIQFVAVTNQVAPQKVRFKRELDRFCC